MKKILIVYASAGAGHRKAAESLQRAFQSLPHGCSVDLVDVLDFTNPFFRWSYEQIYLWMITRATWLWGLCYYCLDSKWMRWMVWITRQVVNRLNTIPFGRYLQEKKYDVILSTHFLATEAAGQLKRGGKIQSQLVTIVTDLGAHAFWVLPEVDLYVAGVEATREDLRERGVRPDRVVVLGIPIHEKFSLKKDVQLLRKKFDLKDRAFTAMLIGGGSGVGPLERMVDRLSSLPVQLLVVCGKNKVLYQKLVQKSGRVPALLRPFGYIDNIDELMAVSDCIVTKSGGLTVSEALGSHLPLIVIDPIPGQERKNCDVVVKAGAAVETGNPDEIRTVIQDFIAHPERIDRMKQKAEQMSRPYAAKDIAELAVRLTSK